MKFIAILKQPGGCDHTISCGTDVVKIEAKNLDEAKNKLMYMIKLEYTDQYELSEATLIEYEEELKINLESLYKNRKDENNI